MTDQIIRGRDVGGAPNDTRFGAHKRTDDDITLHETPAPPTGLTFDDAPLERLKLDQGPRAISYLTRDDDDNESELILDAPYQRGSVWDETRKQNLVRSVLIGLPAGSITINTQPYERHPGRADAVVNVVDGKQRIEALRGFVRSDYAIPSGWLHDEDVAETTDVPGWPAPGVFFKDTTIAFQRSFLRNPFSVVEAHLGSMEEEAELFRLINAGGVEQTDETMANALAVEQGRAD
ncbi:DUF262 domain-containing protein [Curtobacterium sp. MCSS17_016]|uniref:DUF262 domain-containing protein n=1 Tax=Curtobacterium sp. MCSS17_016 TaxID=2175644 RepID=UPI000DA88A79|nr:DUF262 domain-containing protein [Curtobacterium sp. MCSS17_016]WIE81131.1 DUF262 domain-containing protein [Curtobacterium sp. MCSS17_016]